MRNKGKFGMLNGSEIVSDITIPALRNDVTHELFREITRQVPFLHDKDPGEPIRSNPIFLRAMPVRCASFVLLPLTLAACLCSIY